MCFSFTATTWRLMEGVDGTNINTNPLMYTCEVGMIGEDDIKGKEWEKRGEGNIL